MSGILEMFQKYRTEKLVGYFLILWGISHFLSVISSLSYTITHLGLGSIMDLAWAIVDLLSGLILIILGNRISNESQ